MSGPDLLTHWLSVVPYSVNLRYQLELPLETPSNNVIKGMHFLAYRQLRKSWQLLVRSALQEKPVFAPLERSLLVISRECSGPGLDWDNAYGGLKPLLDCLVAPSRRNPDGLGLVLDDNLKAMPLAPLVFQAPAKPGAGRTLIDIYELT